MKKNHYKTVFISDIHLWNPKNQWDKLIKFLDSIEFENLIIIWDFIDYRRLNWFWEWKKKEEKTLKYINHLSTNWINITYIQWNHDRQLKCSQKIYFNNMNVCKDTYYTTSKWKTYFITHWDCLLSGLINSDFIWKLWTKICGLSLKFENILNKHICKKSHISSSEKINNWIKSVLFSPKKIENRIYKFLEYLDCDWTIIWHFHDPKQYSIDWIDYFNTWDRIKNCSAIVEDSAWNLNLIFYKD